MNNLILRLFESLVIDINDWFYINSCIGQGDILGLPVFNYSAYLMEPKKAIIKVTRGP